jgi:DNA-binding beta-propeller fold protein YncE
MTCRATAAIRLGLAPLALAAVLGAALGTTLDPAPAWAAASYAFVTGTDFFGPGCASWVSLDAPRTAHDCVTPISSDPVARSAFGRVYVVNRYGADNVQVLGPAHGFATERQFSVGNGANPQDIAVLSPSKAYVSLLNAPYLLVVDPRTGAALDSIPLAAFADADGLPEAYKMWIHGDRVFLTLERLANYLPTDYSLIAVIDASADTVVDADPAVPGVQAIRLTGLDPNGDLAYDPAADVLLVGEVGQYGIADGGVERIDPVGLRALGFETTEAQLEGELGEIALAPNGAAYAVVSDFGFTGSSRLVRYDRATGALLDTLFTTGGASLADLEVNDRGELWLCDRSLLAPGMRVFDTATDAPLAGPIDVGAPPFTVCFGDAADGGPGPASPGLALLGLGPNPAGGDFEVRFQVGDDARLPVRLRVFDARGAEVGRVEVGPLGAGDHSASWHASGRQGPGIYFFRLERGGRSARGRFVLIR